MNGELDVLLVVLSLLVVTLGVLVGALGVLVGMLDVLVKNNCCLCHWDVVFVKFSIWDGAFDIFITRNVFKYFE